MYHKYGNVIQYQSLRCIAQNNNNNISTPLSLYCCDAQILKENVTQMHLDFFLAHYVCYRLVDTLIYTHVHTRGSDSFSKHLRVLKDYKQTQSLMTLVSVCKKLSDCIFQFGWRGFFSVRTRNIGRRCLVLFVIETKVWSIRLL